MLKCHGFGPIASVDPHRRIITFIECKAIQKKKTEGKREVDLMEDREEVVEEADGGELLVSRGTLHGFKGFKDE